jgi:hypothetical protein
VDRRHILAVTALVPVLLIGVAPAIAHAARPSAPVQECEDVFDDSIGGSKKDCDY